MQPLPQVLQPERGKRSSAIKARITTRLRCACSAGAGVVLPPIPGRQWIISAHTQLLICRAGPAAARRAVGRRSNSRRRGFVRPVSMARWELPRSGILWIALPIAPSARQWAGCRAPGLASPKHPALTVTDGNGGGSADAYSVKRCRLESGTANSHILLNSVASCLACEGSWKLTMPFQREANGRYNTPD